MPKRSAYEILKSSVKKHLSFVLQSHFLKHATDITHDLPLGPLLIIAPHPDDETLGCSALIRHYHSKGLVVRIVVVTDGSKAQLPRNPAPQEIASIRRKESIHAAQILGLAAEDVLFLSYPDGEAEQNESRIADDIESQIWLYQPALIAAPHLIDAHADHRVVARILRALRQQGKVTCPIFEYPMWFWPKGAFKHLFSSDLMKTHKKVSAAEHLDLKKQAIDAHVCQKEEENWHRLEELGIAHNLRNAELYFEIPAEK